MTFWHRLQQWWTQRTSVVQPKTRTAKVYRPHSNLALEAAYEKVEWVRACVDVLGRNVQQCPVYGVKKVAGQKPKPLPDVHPLQRLILRPNEEEDFSSIVEAITVHQHLRGEALLELDAGKVGDVMRPPANLYVNPPQWIERVDFDWPNRRYAKFWINAEGRSFELDGQNGILSKFYNPSNVIRGLSPLAAAFAAADSTYAANIFNRAYFDRGGTLSLALTFEKDAFDGELTKDTRDRIREELQLLTQGVDKWHGVGVFGPGEKLVELGRGAARDMDFGQLLKANRTAICAVYGVAEILLGIVENANRANAIEQRAMLWEEKLIPYVQDLESLLNRKLARRFGDDVAIYFDYLAVPAMRRDLKKLADALVPLIEKDAITVNEAREEIGYAPVPWGDVPWSQHASGEPAPEPDDVNEGISTESALAMVGEWKNATLSRIREGAKSPIQAFPPAREARKAAKKFGVPHAAAWQLARSVQAELAVKWNTQRPADGAAELFESYAAQIKFKAGAGKGIIQ